MTQPTEGGRYSRDPVTGALTKMVDVPETIPTEPPQAAAPAPAPKVLVDSDINPTGVLIDRPATKKAK